MSTAEGAKSEKLGAFPYVVGGLSFIPLIGVLFGIVAIVWGLATGKRGGKRLALIGAAGIVFTIALYGSFFYFSFVQRGGEFDELRLRLAQSTINDLVPAIELYKIQNGRYPDSLKELQQSLPKETVVSVFDPTHIGFSGRPTYFFYERVGEDHYYLRGLGPDGIPFTAGDIVPQLPSGSQNKTGLLTQRQATP